MQTTSLNSYYREVKPTLGVRQETVYNAMRTREDWTNSELAAYLDWPINTVCPRCHELRKAGLVVEGGKRICAVTGRRVIAWRVVRDTLF